ncbi:MAG: NAD(P)H-dependent oxidoreductase [Myxococcota bacterium]
MSRILVLVGHPRHDSLCTAMAEQYAGAATAQGAEVRLVHLADLAFDPILREGFGGALEPDLQQVQRDIAWAEHLVLVFPIWWANVPALLKGFCDRVFLPGFAFRYQSGSALPLKLLKGRTARLLITMDSPPWYYRWFAGAPADRAMIGGTLEFCGISVKGRHHFGSVRGSTEPKRKAWLARAAELGRGDGGR